MLLLFVAFLLPISHQNCELRYCFLDVLDESFDFKTFYQAAIIILVKPVENDHYQNLCVKYSDVFILFLTVTSLQSSAPV